MLYLVRHGRTAINAQQRLQGRIDPTLDDLGERQARAIADHVVGLTGGRGGIARVVSSPLRRARQTASCLGLPIDEDDRWIEMNYGDYEGAALSEVPSEVWQRWNDDPDFAIEGGESFAMLLARVRESLDELSRAAVDEHIVVVSHMTPIKAAVAWALGADYQTVFRCHLSHAALTVIGFGRFGPVLHQFNRTVDVDAP